jgi:hypothetical protein
MHDEHVAAVVERLDGRDVRLVVVDVTELEEQGYLLHGRELWVGKAGTAVELAAGTRGWIRRLAPPQWRPGTRGGSQAAAVRTAWTALMVGIAGDGRVEWLTQLEHLFLCENKLLQERTARELGILTPQTAVTSDRSLIPSELDRDLIAKPLGAGHFANDDASEQVVWTQPLDVAAPELDLLAGAPFILQARVDAQRHLRVVTVRDRVWVYELDAAGLELDWRVTEEAHHSFAAAQEPEVARQALTLASETNVGYSSQDWIVAGGDAYFVDLNPAGQWLFLPEPDVSDITGSIAAWLVGETP